MTKVLIIEDSPTQAQELRLILEHEGFEVSWARSGGEGMARLEKPDFDFILSDVMMPDFTGYEVCRKAKELSATRDIPFILLTTLTDPLDIVQGLQCGADNYLTKPIEPKLLAARVRSILESRRRRAAGKLRVGVDVFFGGKRFEINSDKEQILDLLMSAIDDASRANAQLRRQQADLVAAQASLERYAKRSEGLAEGARRKYESLMEQANDAVFLLDVEGRVLEANRQAQALLGRPADELAAREAAEFSAAADREAFVALLARTRAEGAARSEEVRVVRPAGEERWVDCSASAVRVEERDAVLLIARDVSERRALARQTRQSQRLEAVGRLAGGIAHDFNNILTVISGFGSFLLAAIPPADASHADVQEILKAGGRAAALTRQLLAFSRQQVLQPRLLDVNAVIRGMEGMFRRLIGADIEVVYTLGAGLSTVKADPGQVEQVIMNLVLNARDAMPKGGRIEIATSDTELDAEFVVAHLGSSAGAHVRIRVSDNGSGMDAETMAHIFEPFFTTKETGKGTGLGLATVYGIVKQSGGSVFLDSAPGSGSHFDVYLPIVQEPAEPLEPGAGPDAPGGSETILLVEDDEMVRAFARRALSQRGYKVLEARDAAEALGVCEREKKGIAILLTDVMMPKMKGSTLAGLVRERLPGIKTIFMSGYTEEVRLDAELSGDALFLQKPMTPETLARAVRKALDKPDR